MIILFRDSELGFTIEWSNDNEITVYNAAHDSLSTIIVDIDGVEDAYKVANFWYYEGGKDRLLAAQGRKLSNESRL